MRWSLFAVSLFLVCPVLAGPPVLRMTLSEALDRAEGANPELRSARAALLAAEGESAEAASLFRDNPALTFEQSRRQGYDAAGLGSTFRESAVGLSQTIEIAGQQEHRRQAAGHALAAARAELEGARIRMRAEVEGAFANVLVLQRRRAAEERNLALVDEASAAIGKRVAAGEDSRLDGNLAAVESDRARNQVAATTEQLLQARARLSALLQLPAEALPEALGDLVERIPGYRLDDLLARAAERPESRALAEREASASRRLALERASVYPDVTVGLLSAREGPPELRERATTLTLSVPLPLFRRNQAGIGRASAEQQRAAIEREAVVRNGQAAVREQWQRLASLESRLSRFNATVLPRLDENLALSGKAFRAGEIGIVALILVNRQALDARREFLEVLGEFTQARIALEQAAGLHASTPDSRP